jgi:enterochelin esterase-like enzyme
MAGRSLRSPRLLAFQRTAGSPGTPGFERGWSRLVRGGLPLIERIPDRPGQRLVTFVWRPERAVRAPSVYTPVADLRARETALIPLARTGLWFRSLRLPLRTRALYAFSPEAPPGPHGGGEAWTSYFRGVRPDPHNPVGFVMAKDPDDPEDVESPVSVVALPRAPPQPWSEVRGPSRWQVTHLRWPSRFLGTSRSVWVYRPRGGRPDRVANLLVVLDGVVYASAIPAPRIVQNLVGAGAIGPSTVVLVGNAVHARDEELAHNPRFARFLAEELIPRLGRRYGVSSPPARTVIAGSSLGGLMAAYAALQYPERFGNVLAQSGAFLWSPPGHPGLIEEYRTAPVRPLRFYLDAGTFEARTPPGVRSSLLSGVRALRDVLRAKGYPVTYSEFEGGHDYACWAGTFADGLLALLGQDGTTAPSRTSVRKGSAGGARAT